MPLTLSIVAYFVVAVIILLIGRRLGRGVTTLAALPYIGQLALVFVLWPDRGTASSEGDPDRDLGSAARGDLRTPVPVRLRQPESRQARPSGSSGRDEGRVAYTASLRTTMVARPRAGNASRRSVSLAAGRGPPGRGSIDLG